MAGRVIHRFEFLIDACEGVPHVGRQNVAVETGFFQEGGVRCMDLVADGASKPQESGQVLRKSLHSLHAVADACCWATNK